MPELTLEQWVLGLVGAFLIGLAKGGLPALGNLTAGIYAVIFASRASVGILLPVLISADIVAVCVYRRHALWPYIRRLLPWTMVGLILGWWLFGYVGDREVQILIGLLLFFMTGVHFLRLWLNRKAGEDKVPSGLAFCSFSGIMGGFSTMMANAAGPVMALYFLAMKLPKYAFIGTAAWYFFIVNVIKIPFMVHRDIIHFQSIAISACFVPAAMTGAFVAPRIVKYINQRLFEGLIWVFVIVAGLGLLFKPDWPTLLFQYAAKSS